MKRRQAITASLLGSAAAGSQTVIGASESRRIPGVFNVRDYRARGDGKTLDTACIQAAIDACTQSGGGLVIFPKGRFLSGTITLKDNVRLHLAPDAVLLGSTNPKDYPAKPFPARDLDVGGFDIWALVYAEGARNMGIEGDGTIHGNSATFPPTKHEADIAGSVRPRAIFFKNCTQVRLREFTLRESAMWSVHLALCEKVFVEGISVYSSQFVNQDGIVLDSCRDGFVSGCFVNTYDDAIVIKTSYPQPCKNISIANCVLTSRCAAIKFGTQSLGAFRNVTISNCSIYDCGLGGVKFFTVDGGDLEEVTVSNLTMTNVSAPIFFRLGNRAQDFGFKDVRQPLPVAKLRNVLVSGIRAVVSGVERWPNRRETMRSGATMGITGLQGHPVENIVLDNIHVTYPGGGTLEEAHRSDVPERESAYPENTAFGVLPAYGLYLRHATGITLRNIKLDLTSVDMRSALICDDVQDLDLSGFRAPVFGSEPLIRLRGTRGALIQSCRPVGKVRNFLSVEDAQCAGIAMMTNDFRDVETTTITSGGFDGRIHEAGNLSAGQKSSK